MLLGTCNAVGSYDIVKIAHTCSTCVDKRQLHLASAAKLSISIAEVGCADTVGRECTFHNGLNTQVAVVATEIVETLALAEVTINKDILRITLGNH